MVKKKNYLDNFPDLLVSVNPQKSFLFFGLCSSVMFFFFRKMWLIFFEKNKSIFYNHWSNEFDKFTVGSTGVAIPRSQIGSTPFLTLSWIWYLLFIFYRWMRNFVQCLRNIYILVYTNTKICQVLSNEYIIQNRRSKIYKYWVSSRSDLVELSNKCIKAIPIIK